MPDNMRDNPPSEELRRDLEATADPDKKAIVLRAMARLETAIGLLSERLKTADAFAARTRNIAIACVVASVVALIGAGIACFAAIGSNNANDKAERNADYNVASCQGANGTRADALGLWTNLNDLIDVLLPQSNPKIPKDVRKKITDLRAHANETYAQRDCSSVKDGIAPTVPPKTN